MTPMGNACMSGSLMLGQAVGDSKPGTGLISCLGIFTRPGTTLSIDQLGIDPEASVRQLADAVGPEPHLHGVRTCVGGSGCGNQIGLESSSQALRSTLPSEQVKSKFLSATGFVLGAKHWISMKFNTSNGAWRTENAHCQSVCRMNNRLSLGR